jgi:hypothetical protein
VHQVAARRYPVREVGGLPGRIRLSSVSGPCAGYCESICLISMHGLRNVEPARDDVRQTEVSRKAFGPTTARSTAIAILPTICAIKGSRFPRTRSPGWLVCRYHCPSRLRAQLGTICWQASQPAHSLGSDYLQLSQPHPPFSRYRFPSRSSTEKYVHHEAVNCWRMLMKCVREAEMQHDLAPTVFRR